MSGRGSLPATFFSKDEKKQILSAIQEAEKNTSGEIRIHLEHKIKGDILGHAKEVFNRIGMSKTQDRNGVLIFLATHSKRFAVLGDVGINEKVPEGFWDNEVLIMQDHFKRDQFAKGLSQAICLIGGKLKEFFPYHAAGENELSDDISY